MKTTIIMLSAILTCLTLLAQETSSPAEQRFTQLDKNDDGKVRAEELTGPLFNQMDKDGDGF